MFALRFPAADSHQYADAYTRYVPEQHNAPALAAGQFMREEGYLSKPHFIALGEWKTPRNRRHYKANAPDYIEAVTRAAYHADNERFRIEVLCLLQGVSWPTASVLLHFGHPDPYPILDFRALWSSGIDEPPRYTYPFWAKYVAYTRKLSARHDLSMRALDAALWTYSKVNQG